MLRYAVLLVALVASASLTEALETRPCPGAAAEGGVHPSRVEITGCTQMPCELIRGSDVAMELDFVSRK